MIPHLSTDRPIDDRAVSEILGAVMMFALLLALLTIVQVAAVPVANQETEFDHNQRVQGDFQSLAATVDRAATLGAQAATDIEAGHRYPNRLFLLNPPAPSGTIATETGTFAIRNATATNRETRDYLAGENRTFETRAVRYRAGYNEYGNAPVTRYEGWTLYNEYETADVVSDRSGLLADRRITLTALDGTLSGGSPGTVTMQATPISAPSRPVSVQGQGPDAPVTIRLTTGLGADAWADVLADERFFASATQVDDRTVDIELAYAETNAAGDLVPITYDLRLAKVGIGPDTTDEGAHYLTTTDRLPQVTTAGGTVTVEVRDRFNAPVAGSTVAFEATDASLLTADGDVGATVNVTSDEDGRASVAVVNPLNDVISVTARADVGPGDRRTDREAVSFSALRVEGRDTEDDGEINPDHTDAVKFISSRLVASGPNENQAPYFVDVHFLNRAPTNKTVAAVRVNGYISNTFSQSQGTIVPDAVRIDNGSLHGVGDPWAAPDGDFEAILEPGVPETYRFEFRLDGANYEPDRGDTIIYSITFDDGSIARYFFQTDDR